MNVLVRACVLSVAVAALATPVSAEPLTHPDSPVLDPGRAAVAFAAFGSARTDVLLMKKHGQSDRDFRHACDKRNGVVTKRAEKVVCVARMHVGSMRGSYDRVPAGDPGTMPPQAQPHG
jgi:hypothetical protein